MIKKIIFIQIISLALCSFSMAEAGPTNNKSSNISQEEQDAIKLANILFSTLNGNWIQEKRYKNGGIGANYSIHLKKDGSIESVKLCNIFCGDDLNNECETFVSNTKKTIFKSFPIKELSSINYSNWEYLHLAFGSKEGNELFTKQQIKK